MVILISLPWLLVLCFYNIFFLLADKRLKQDMKSLHYQILTAVQGIQLQNEAMQSKALTLAFQSCNTNSVMLNISNTDRLSSIPKYKHFFFLLVVRSSRSPEVSGRVQVTLDFLRADNLSLALVLIAADARLLSWLSCNIFIL